MNSLPEPDFGSFWRLDAQHLALSSVQSIVDDLEALQNHLWELRGFDFRARTLLPSGSLYNPAREFWEQAGQKYLELMACLEHITSIDPSTHIFVYASALSVAEFKFCSLAPVSKMQHMLHFLIGADWFHMKEKMDHFAKDARVGMENDEVMEIMRTELIADVTKLQVLTHTTKIELIEVVGFVKHAMYEAW
ncbi:MAG: hypothetical protein LQ347_005360, partial [Umbilicaria vellea]